MGHSVQSERAEGEALALVHGAFFPWPGGRGGAGRPGGPAGGGSGPTVSLDSATELVSGTPPGPRFRPGSWVLTLYGGAGEAVIRRVPRQKAAKPVDMETGEIVIPEPDPDRAAEEAARRARANLRRYAVHNRLKFMWTLTYGAADRLSVDRSRVAVDVDRMVRRLRADRGGRLFPFAYVIEPHKDGALHVHMLVGFFIDWRKMRERWGQGHVFVTDPRKTLLPGERVTDNGLANARRAASYASKYLAKGFGESAGRGAGGHRYEVAQGFLPTRDDVEVHDLQDGRDTAADRFGGPGWVVFCSADRDDWQAPPVELWFFGQRPSGMGKRVAGGLGGTGPP